MTAYRYVRTGELPASQADGRWQVALSDLAEFEAGRAAKVGRPGRPRSGSSPVNSSLSPRRAVALADRLIAGDQGGSWRLIEDALDTGAGLADVNEHLITPALRDIGERWVNGEASVGDEHRATVVAMRLNERLSQRFMRSGPRRGTVLVSAAPGDRHSMPSAILADLLRTEGLEVIDLGADTPAEEIVKMAARQDRLLGVGICVTNELDDAAEKSLRKAVKEVGKAANCPVLVGGSAVLDEAMATRLGSQYWSSNANDAVRWFVDLAKRP